MPPHRPGPPRITARSARVPSPRPRRRPRARRRCVRAGSGRAARAGQAPRRAGSHRAPTPSAAARSPASDSPACRAASPPTADTHTSCARRRCPAPYTAPVRPGRGSRRRCSPARWRRSAAGGRRSCTAAARCQVKCGLAGDAASKARLQRRVLARRERAAGQRPIADALGARRHGGDHRLVLAHGKDRGTEGDRHPLGQGGMGGVRRLRDGFLLARQRTHQDLESLNVSKPLG